MPEDPPPKGPAAELCPRCGSPLHRTSAGLVCFLCLGERVLRFDDEAAAPPGADASFVRRLEAFAPAGAGPALEKLGGYELLDEVGRGGMGVVYTARQAGLDRVVALKVIAAGRLATADHEMRFLREAQTAARLRHRHILTVHDAGRAEGHAFYTMDYVETGDLARRLRAGPLPFRDSAEIVAACAEAIAYAHTQGVLHRDLKPSNILLDGGEPRIADFGLASSLAEGAELTAHSQVLGTPHYLAPETVAGGTRAATPASDVYALGAILFELVAGRTPFGGATTAQVLQLAGKQEAPALHLLNPAVPRDLETIVAKTLENDPARRYPDAAALAADLRRFLAGEIIHARPVGPAERFLRWCRRRPALATVWFLVATLAAGSTFAAVRFLRERRRAEAGETRAVGAERSAREELARALAAETRAVAAERAARDELARGKLAEARALKVTGRDGRRFAALAAVAEAARVRPTRELRDEAAALLTLFDARVARRWHVADGRDVPHAFLAAAGLQAVELGAGQFVVRGLDDDRDRARLTGCDGRWIGTPRFSAGGRWLAARGDDETLRVWDAAAGGAPRLVLPGRTLPVRMVSQDFAFDFDFSPDETRFAAGRPDGAVTVHRLDGPAASAAEPTAAWPGPGKPNIVRFSPDGARVAVATADVDAVRLHDAASGAVVGSLALPVPAIAAEWSPDGTRVAVPLRSARTWVFDVASGERRAELRTPDVIPTTALFLGDSRRLLTGGTDRVLRLWDAPRERVVLEIAEWGANPVLTRAAEDRRLTASRWSTDEAGVLELSPSPVRRSVSPATIGVDRASIGAGGLAVSPDGKWAAIANRSATEVRRLDDLALVARFEPAEAGDATALFAGDGRALFVADVTGGVTRRELTVAADDAVSFGPPATVVAEPGWRVYAAAPHDGRIVLAHHERGLVRVVDPARPDAAVEWKSEGVWCAAFGPDGAHVVTQSGNIGHPHEGPGPEIRDARSGALVRALPAGRIGELAWSAGGALAVIGARELQVFDRPLDGAARKLEDGVLPGGTLVAFSADGSWIAHSTGEGIELRRPASGECVVRLRPAEAASVPFAIEFTPDGERLVANDTAGATIVWEVAVLRRELRALGLDWE